jgi:flavin-binding protein dodecin
MTESAYKVIELIGTSAESWEKAAQAAVDRAGKSLRDLRVGEIVKLDLQLDAQGKDRSLPRQAERLVQIRGLANRPSSSPAAGGGDFLQALRHRGGPPG